MRTSPALPVLGSLQADIMAILWQREQATVKDIHDILEREREIAYTTVLTTMTRLADRGILRRSGGGRGRGFTHHYTAAVSREELAIATARQVVAELLGGDAQPIVQALAAA